MKVEQAYRIKEGLLNDEEDLNKFGELGYELVPFDNSGTSDYILIKVCKQPFDSEIVQGSLKNIYNNKQWKSMYYNKNKEKISKTLDLHYQGGKAVLTEKFKNVLQNWQLRIWSPLTDGVLSVHSGDPFEAREWRSAKNVEEIAADEIIRLMDLGYIEPINIEYEEE